MLEVRRGRGRGRGPEIEHVADGAADDAARVARVREAVAAEGDAEGVEAWVVGLGEPVRGGKVGAVEVL